MRKLLCLFGMHERDRNRVRHDGEEYVAPCRGCGRQMLKTRSGKRRWVLADRTAAHGRRHAAS